MSKHALKIKMSSFVEAQCIFAYISLTTKLHDIIVAVACCFCLVKAKERESTSPLPLQPSPRKFHPLTILLLLEYLATFSRTVLFLKINANTVNADLSTCTICAVPLAFRRAAPRGDKQHRIRCERNFMPYR